MENNNYNNNNNNMTGAFHTEQDTAANTSASTGSQNNDTVSGAYGFSYVNQENKDPNNIWRADENTASFRQSQSNSYSNAQAGYDQSNSYTNTQNSYTSSGSYTNTQGSYSSAGGYQNSRSGDYSNIYGEQAATNGFKTYTQDRQSKRENRAKKRAEFKANNSGFGIKMAKAASIALVFGLVAGTAFEGSSYLLGSALGTKQEASVEAGSGNVSEDKSVLSATDSSNVANAIATSASSTANVSAIVEECMPSIVAITNMSEVQYQSWFGQIQNYESESAGSGIIVSEDDTYLYIATNNHVVENATTLTIQFSDDSTAAAEVKGTMPSSDLAVVQVAKADIEASTLEEIKIATLGDSDTMQVGSEAIAIGNALGYGQSVTTGVISALNRSVTTQDETSGESYTNSLIQTDAAINPGNSGGALLNSNGEVIGINSAKYSDTTVEGMGFAIPINTAKPIIEDLITREVVSEDKQAFLGIKGVDVTSQVAATYNMPEGVYVAEVTAGTAAEKAGMQKGDIITQFDGKEIKSMESLQSMLTYYEAGTQVKITIQRSSANGYEEITLDVTLGKKTAATTH